MKVLKDYNLTKHNNLRLQSVAKEFYVPESYEELKNIIRELNERKTIFQILSGGSNVLVKPVVKTPVISLTEVDKTLSYDKASNTVVAGCSVKIQTFINFLADNDLGGIEYLYSLPALVGGCVYMNAGRGRKYNQSISDYIVAVEYLEDQELKQIKKQDCAFGYRKSVFQNSGKVITKAIFQFPHQEKAVTKKNIKERMEYVKLYQEPQKPSLGSIFCDVDFKLIRRFKGMRVGNAVYSKKTTNWISNLGNAKYSHIMALITVVKVASFLTRKKAELELKIFK